MAFKIEYSDQVARAFGIKALVYGRPGTGKTVLCATGPNPLIISAESGLLSIRHMRVPVVQVTTIQDVLDVYNWLRTPAARDIHTVCLDSLSEIAEKVLTAEKRGKSHGQQAYGAMNDRVIEMAKDFRDLPGKHVIFTAKEGFETNNATGITRIVPEAPGKTIGPALPYLFDIVLHLEVGRDPQGNTFHYARTRPDAMVDAKDRSGKLNEIEYLMPGQPNLTNLFNKIMGG